MLSVELFDKLNYIGKKIRYDDTPFGGIQLILLGDFAQLRAIKSEKFLFESQLFRDVIKTTIYLKKNMRQSDIKFQEILSKIRLGELDKDSSSILRSRLKIKLEKRGIKPTRLFATKVDTNYINELELKKINREIVEFKCIKKVKYPNNVEIDYKLIENVHIKLAQQSLVEDTLKLSIGAQVMLVKNVEPLEGLVNGSRGIIVDILEKGVYVQFIKNENPKFISFHCYELKVPIKRADTINISVGDDDSQMSGFNDRYGGDRLGRYNI